MYPITVTNHNRLDIEQDTWMSNPTKAFSEQRKWVWFNKDLSIRTKWVVYCTIVLSIFLYGTQTWTIYKADVQRLHVYMIHHMCKILNIEWWQHILNKFILEKSKLPGMHNLLTQCNLRWAGHLNRLEDSRQSKQILNSQLREESCKTGRLKLRHEDIIKRNLGLINIPLNN